MSLLKRVFNNLKDWILRIGRQFLIISIIFMLVGNVLYYLDINGYFNQWRFYPGPGGTVIHLSISKEGDIIIDTSDNISYILNIERIFQYKPELFKDGKLIDKYSCIGINPIYVINPPKVVYEKVSIKCKSKDSYFIIHIIRSNENELWVWNTNLITTSNAKYYFFFILMFYVIQYSLFIIVLLIGKLVFLLSYKIRPTRGCSRLGQGSK